jgi:hypothetical protein
MRLRIRMKNADFSMVCAPFPLKYRAENVPRGGRKVKEGKVLLVTFGYNYSFLVDLSSIFC